MKLDELLEKNSKEYELDFDKELEKNELDFEISNYDFEFENKDLEHIDMNDKNADSDIFNSDFLDQFNFEEKIKIKSLNKDSKTISHNLSNDIDEIIRDSFHENIRDSKQIASFINEKLETDYGMNLTDLIDKYNEFDSKNTNQYLEQFNFENDFDEMPANEQTTMFENTSDYINENFEDNLEKYEVDLKSSEKNSDAQNILETIDLNDEINEVNEMWNEEKDAINIKFEEQGFQEINEREFIEDTVNDDLDDINFTNNDSYTEQFDLSQVDFEEKNSDSIELVSDLNDTNYDENESSTYTESFDFSQIDFKENNNDSIELTSDFSEAIENRLENADKDCKEIYDVFKEKIEIGDATYYDTPHYNMNDQKIYFNQDIDSTNKLGVGSTYFHEVGHLIDTMAGNGHSSLSDDPMFSKFLREDFQDYVEKTKLAFQCNTIEAYDIISEELMNDSFGCASDLYGGLSNRQCEGFWHHSQDYWEMDKRIEKEAFAHFYESSSGIKEKADVICKFFPKSYQRFKYLVKEGIKWN